MNQPLTITSSTADWKHDARNWQILFLFTFLSYGTLVLHWAADIIHFAVVISTCFFTQLFWIHYKKIPFASIRSALITSLGLCILMKSNNDWVLMLGSFLAISSKFMIRFRGKHLFNPANFGLIAAIVLTGEAWVSPGQWGSGWTAILLVATGGLLVLTKCGRVETGLAFLATYLGVFLAFNILYKGWPMDFFLHQAFNGTLWLFAFFMITDPMTTPNNKTVRLVWAVLVALVALYLNQLYWITSAPVWVLFFSTPVVVILDQIVKGEKFNWVPTNNSITQQPIT